MGSRHGTPNQFALTDRNGLSVTYNATSISGQPQLQISFAGAEDHTFTGPQLDTQEIEAGHLITVTLDHKGLGDSSHTQLMTVLLPALSEAEIGKEVLVQGVAILIDLETNADLAIKPAQYEPVRLYGTARFVES